MIEKNENGFIDIEVKQLLDWKENEGCIVSDKITKEGWCVGYMYREKGENQYPDSGWRFLKGDEDDVYMNDVDNHHVFSLNTICNYDPAILPYLYSSVGSAYIRVSAHEFVLDKCDREIYFKKQDR